jgi:hypothetical protein
MKNSTSRKVITLATTLAIALPLTINPAIAQSDASSKSIDITTAVNGGPIIGNGSPAAFGGSPVEVSRFRGTAALAIGNDSTVRIGDIDVKGHSDLSIIGSKYPEVQTTLKDITSVFILRSVLGNPVLVDAPPLSGIPSPMTGSPDSVKPTNCSDPATTPENILLSSATGVCLGGMRVEITRFNGTTASPTVASPLGGNIAVRNNSVVRATLTDVTITTNSTKRGDSTSNDVRIGGIVIR